MIGTAFSPVIENWRPFAISQEASFVRRNVEKCFTLFINHSVFVKEQHNLQVKQSFEGFKEVWLEKTKFSSNISDITNNSAYLSIIELGTDVVPFIIKDLRITDNHWFYALEAITMVNPISKDHQGKIALMKNDWLKWAESNFDIDEL